MLSQALVAASRAGAERGGQAVFRCGLDDNTAGLQAETRKAAWILGPHPHLPGTAGISLNGTGAVRGFSRDTGWARQARHFVQCHLGTRFDRQVAVDAAITAELAANAVLHARSPVHRDDLSPAGQGADLRPRHGTRCTMAARCRLSTATACTSWPKLTAAAWAAESLPTRKTSAGLSAGP